MHSTRRSALPMPLPLAALLCAALLALAASGAGAFPGGLSDWQARYGAVSSSGDSAQCQLCHADANGGSPWNGYGWDIRNALADAACDLDGDGSVSNDEAFYCVETRNSDGDTGNHDDLAEIGAGTQPGWTLGANTLYDRTGAIPNQPAPANIGRLDPAGTEPAPQPRARVVGADLRNQVVRPGQSIQRAVDRARPGGWIFLLPGEYRELGDPTNALAISKSLKLVGLSSRDRRVVLANAGNQRNGIVVVPEDRQDCMSCHSDMAPPFPIHPGVEPGLKMREPMIHGFGISGVTIQGFRNNGLFTENVNGFAIVDVHSVDNRNYGIFPTLSKNGVIAHSVARGSDIDSGIWVETSENVQVVHNLAEGNVNGFEVSNSDDITLAFNESRNNTVGAAILLLPDIFDDRAGAKRIHMRNNWIHDNNKPNTARPGSILSFVPSGTGILYLGVDDSDIADNVVTGNDFAGIAIADYCASVLGTPFQCPPPFPSIPGLPVDPSITPEFLADQGATGNRVTGNLAVDNGLNPPGPPFGGFAADLTLLTFGDGGNCYADNVFASFFSLIGVLPPCQP